MAGGFGGGHVQSLIFASTLMLLGFMTVVVGLQADVIANNRKILEDMPYRIRRQDLDNEAKANKNRDKSQGAIVIEK